MDHTEKVETCAQFLFWKNYQGHACVITLLRTIISLLLVNTLSMLAEEVTVLSAKSSSRRPGFDVVLFVMISSI